MIIILAAIFTLISAKELLASQILFKEIKEDYSSPIKDLIFEEDKIVKSYNDFGYVFHA